MNLSTVDPSLYNILFVVMDSCRYDTAAKANIPFIKGLGQIRRALSHADYTLPAHFAMFDGRLPTVEESPFLPLYTDAVRQLWRVSPQGFFETKPKNEIALALTGDNIIEGHRRLGYFALGVASLNYFVRGRPLNRMFHLFLDYYDVKEDLISPRPLSRFPLHHYEDIVTNLEGHDKWFLFINTQETHYPYDIGRGYDPGLLPLLEKMKRHLNMRHGGEKFSTEESDALHQMQIRALETVDHRLKQLVRKLPRNRPILVVITGDHGESFGEEFYGFNRCGHLHPSPEVLHVPLLIGSVES